MSIRSRNLDKTRFPHPNVGGFVCGYPANAPAGFVAAIDIQGMAANTVLTLVKNWAVGWPTRVRFGVATGVGGTGDATFRIQGIDQFGDPQDETLILTPLTASATSSIHSLFAYRRVDRVTMVAEAVGGAAAATLSVGWLSEAAGAGPPVILNGFGIALPVRIGDSTYVAAGTDGTVDVVSVTRADASALPVQVSPTLRTQEHVAVGAIGDGGLVTMNFGFRRTGNL